jgi:uroporphyrinogen-III synthase
MVQRREALLAALATRVVVASIGPMTSESLVDAGLTVDLEPEHPKMGHLVIALARDGARLVDAKRVARS